MTLILMSVMAVVMAVITVFEALEGGGAVPFPYYYAPWFILLLVLVWLNLLLNLLKAGMWKRRRLPLTAAHLGFLLILTGGYQTYALGVRGNLNIMEGDTGSVFKVDGRTLRSFHYDGTNYQADEDFHLEDEGAIRGGGILRVMNPLAPADRVTLDNGETVRVLDHLSSSKVETSLKEVADGTGTPAISLEIGSPPAVRLSLLDGESVRVDRSGFSGLYYYHLPAGAEPGPELLGLVGEWIDIVEPDGDEIHLPLRIPDDLGRTLEQGDYSVEILEYYPDFKTGKKPDLSEPPRNPALHLHVKGPPGEKTLYTFALHEFGGSRFPDGTVVRYRRGAAGGSNLVLLSRGDEGVEVMTSARNEPERMIPGKPLDVGHGEDRLTLTLGACFPSARRDSRVKTDPTRRGPAAYLVQVGDRGEPAWLWNDHGEALSADGATVVIVDDHWNLGFALTLVDAVAEHWPASSIPKAFYSDVRISDRDHPDPVPARIETNAPLSRNGFLLYQSGMDQNPPFRWSTFSVAKDPGVPLVTTGFIVMSLGLLWLFAVRFVIRQFRNDRTAGRVEA
jgi:hypothetical protein